MLKWLGGVNKATNSDFRTDVAGIRGVAVLLVVLAHFKIPGFSSGFIGVDIFFVISGYLITGLLAKEYEKNALSSNGLGWISLRGFYLRRARRILPAALFVLGAIVIFSSSQLNVLRAAQINKDAIWTSLFGANIDFMRQSTDYFFNGLAVSPLLHYWSLGVEEQFYLLWPILFLSAVSFHGLRIFGRSPTWRQRVVVLLASVTGFSFLWMVIEFANNPNGAYFSTLTRGWELGLGAVLSLMKTPQIRGTWTKHFPAARLLMLVALLSSLVVVTNTNFGYALLLPVAATGLLLSTGDLGKERDLATQVLSMKVFTGLGAISFSLYLWHWPIVVLGPELGWMNNWRDRILGIVLAIALATVSYWLIERPFQRIPIKRLSHRNLSRLEDSFPLSKKWTSSVAIFAICGLSLLTYPSALANPFSSNQGGGKAVSWTPPSPTPSQPSNFVVKPETEFNDALNTGLTPANIIRKLEEGIALNRLPNNLKLPLSLVKSDHSIFDKCDGKICALGSGKKLAVLVGDSHAMAIGPSILGSLNLNSWTMVSFVMSACSFTYPAILGSDLPKCDAFRNAGREYIKKNKPDIVFVNQNQALPIDHTWLTGFRESVTLLLKYTKKMVLITPTPQVLSLDLCLGKNGRMTHCSGDDKMLLPYNQAMESLTFPKSTITVIRMTDFLCHSDTCPAIVDDIPVYRDGSHLTEAFSEALVPIFIDIFKRNLS